MKGYTGKVLFVNLSTRETWEENVPDEVYESYLSGVGLGAYMLYKHIPAGADPLGPDNMLGIMSGLLTGTGMPVTGRWMAVCKSPLTGGWGDANCGGTFAPAIKQCGYDAIFFKGIADKPVYLFVDNKGHQILDAGDLWGKDTVETEKILEERHWVKKKPSVITIGPSGEKLSLISGISNDSGRVAARSGVGAVMGSKNLKAVVLAGVKPIKCVDRDAIKEYAKRYAKIARLSLPGFFTADFLPVMGIALDKMPLNMAFDGAMSALILKKFGTAYTNTMGMPSGDCPVKNWEGSVKDFGPRHYNKMNADKVAKREFKKYHCYSCFIGCGGVCNIKDIKAVPYDETHKPEYETSNAFGPLVLNENLDAVFAVNEILNRAGMDSISAGGTVAFAIECYEKGIITKEDTGGLELGWGKANSIIKLVRMMVARKGIGDILADGTKKAAERIGKGSARFAVHAGGQEPGQHDSRMDPSLAVHYATDPTPGRHTIGMDIAYNFYQPWKSVDWAPNSNGVGKAINYKADPYNAEKVKINTCFKQVIDGCGGCYFAHTTGYYNWRLLDAINAATGWNKTNEEYMEIGMRMQCLRQQFNIKHGVDPMSFKPHRRMVGKPPLSEGPLKGKTVPIEEMMRLQWEHYGWSRETGAPLPETLEKYGIDKIEEVGK